LEIGKLSGGRLVEGTVKAISDKTDVDSSRSDQGEDIGRGGGCQV